MFTMMSDRLSLRERAGRYGGTTNLDPVMAADPTLAATALIYSIPSAARTLAAARAETDHWRVELAWAAVGAALILIRQSRLLPRLQDKLTAVIRREAMIAPICAILLVLVVEAARLLAVGLADAIRAPGAFVIDLFDSVLKLPVEASIGGLALWILLCLRRRWPRRGWVGVSLAATALIFATVLIPPITLGSWVRGDQPASGAPTAPILDFVRRGGLDAHSLYVFDSADPVAVDMEGAGPIAHAAVSRAALAAPKSETYAAIGHLLGHYRHKDLCWLAALWSTFATAFCWAVWTSCRRLQRRGQGQAVAASVYDAQALPIVGLIGWGLLLLATPSFNIFDQVINYRADDYALKLTHDPDGLRRWLMTTESGGKADPSLIEALLFYDHPPLKNRLVNAFKWDAAHP